MLRIIPPAIVRPIVVSLPPSKSITNRLLVIRFLSDGAVGASDAGCDDAEIMQSLISKLSSGQQYFNFDAGDAGTVFRFMAAVMSVVPGMRLLSGSERMLQRPCGPLVEALVKLGANIEYTGKPGYPPLKIHGRKLKGGEVDIDAGVSSQFISALMMIAPLMELGLDLKLVNETVSLPYIGLTAELMRKHGIGVEIKLPFIRIHPGEYQAREISEEADWSAAAFWYALAAMTPGISITLSGLRPGSVQGDRAAVRLFGYAGAKSAWMGDELILQNQPYTEEVSIDFNENPDLLPAMAIACAGNGIKARFSGLSTLRIKESDRIEAIIQGLEGLGYHAFSPALDQLVLLPGRSAIKNQVVSSFADHRIAMAFAMLSVKAGPLVIDRPEVVSKSYPAFWDHLKDAGFLLESC